MTSSPSRAPVQSPAAPLPQPAQPKVFAFPYTDLAVSASPRELLSVVSPPTGPAFSDVALREAQAHDSGRKQGELEARTRFEEQMVHERSSVAKALTEFAGERASYYLRIEEEAVKLALSIARKVLHREAQVDPLLLMGILRVALERIEGATGVVLAVHPQQAAVWRNYLISRMGPGDLPEVVEDPAMALEQCQLRTSMGTADLGLEVQLKEIEQGLMDLLAARPQAKP